MSSRRRASASRRVRCAALASLVWGLAVLAHSSAGGGLPSLPVMVATVAVTVPVMIWFTARPMRSTTTAAVLALGQLVLHVSFSVLSGGHARPSAPADHGAGHHHGAAVTPEAASWLDHLGATDPEGLAMLGGHLAAAALVGIWLSVGERALTWLLTCLVVAAAVTAGHVRWLARQATALLAGPVLDVTRPSTTHVRRPARAPIAMTVLCTLVVRRGPPATV